VGITISADDPRSIRAIELAADAAHWRRWRTPEGLEAFGIPSQSRRDRSYVVTATTCNCADFLRAVESGEPRPCKHVLAVRLYLELVRAQQHSPPAVRRSHLRLVN
jgi:SWIM zinc finger